MMKMKQYKFFGEAKKCNGKASYDKKGALTASNSRKRFDHVELRIYPCPDCNMWHLANMDKARFGHRMK